MKAPLFTGLQTLRVKALLISERIDLRCLDSYPHLATTPLLVGIGRDACAAVFRYGAVIFFGAQREDEQRLLSQLLTKDALAQPPSEEAELRLEAGAPFRVENGIITLPDPRYESLQVVAEVLAQSVVLDHQEEAISEAFQRIEPLAISLRKGGHGRDSGRELLQHIGEALLARQRMVGRVEVGEKPDLLWDEPELERFYTRLEDEYELRDRTIALGRKLDLISGTAGTALDLLQNQRSLRVEWYIVALIVVEILLTLYDMFWHP